MADNVPNLGQVPFAEAKRDAVHVAVVPATAGQRLFPGQRVFLYAGKAQPENSQFNPRCIGIVDPYRLGPVYPDAKFWLCLLPGSVTGMRHQWSHPLFDEEETPPAIGAAVEATAEFKEKMTAKGWLEGFATSHGLSMQELEECVREGVANPEEAGMPFDSWDEEEMEDLWQRCEIYFGVRPPDRATFRCAC
jgi:hypothetical protein